MKADRNCQNCGAKLHRDDILCLECETPVITVEDITLMPNAETTLQNLETEQTSALLDTQDLAIPPPVTKPPKRNNNRGSIIAVVIVACIVILGVFLYFIFRPSHPEENGTDTPVEANVPDTQAEQGDISDDPVVDTSQEPEQQEYPDVTSIVLYREGRAQTEFHAMVDEPIVLRAQFLPEGSYAALECISTDPEVLEVVSVDQINLEIVIMGLFPGVADIIVTAGDFEMTYVVFVDDLPLNIQLENAVNNPDEDVWLSLTWTSGQHNGLETIFERVDESRLWVMEGAYSRSDPEPVFGSANNAFTIGFEDTPRVFYFFDDGTGHYRDPDGSNVEDFIWELKTTFIEAEG